MAYVYRLIMRALANRIAFAIVAMLTMALSSQCSHAETIPLPANTFHWQISTPTNTAVLWQGDAQTYPEVVAAAQSAGNCTINIHGTFCDDYRFNYYSVTGTCPSGGYTQVGNTCTRPDCGAGQDRLPDGSCGIDCSAPARNLTGQPYGGAGSLPSSICVAGCTYPITNGATAHKKDGTSFFEGTVGAASGGNCTGQDATNKNDTNRTPEEKCLSNNQGFITTNGTTTCVPAGTSGAPEIVIKDSPNSTTKPSGTTSQQTTTSVNNGQVTTTTQTTDANGQTTTQTQTQSQQSFCQENPNSQICKAVDKGIFSGSCTAGFICSSPDAATCAIAMLAHQSRCQDLVENDSTGLGKSLIAGTDVQANDPRAEGNITTINVASFDATPGPVGAGGCITDRVVSMGQGSITLPFSKLCPYINMLGYALLSIAWITAGRIVGKA